MSEFKHTPGPHYVGSQNDAIYIIAGREPALSNDHPWHDAPRVCLAKVYGPTEGDCLPVDQLANAQLFAASEDLLAACIAIRDHAKPSNWDDEDQPGEPGYEAANAWRALDAAITKAKGGVA